MPKLLGIVGILVVCAGLDLLWQSRAEISFWLAAYLKAFRSVLRQPGAPPRGLPEAVVGEKRHGAVRFLVGMSFVFFFGPILIAIGITLMLLPKT
jgi:hypothetical protein